MCRWAQVSARWRVAHRKVPCLLVNAPKMNPAATWLIMDGVPLSEVARQLGKLLGTIAHMLPAGLLPFQKPRAFFAADRSRLYSQRHP